MYQNQWHVSYVCVKQELVAYSKTVKEMYKIELIILAIRSTSPEANKTRELQKD